MIQDIYDLYIVPYTDYIAVTLLTLGVLLAPLGFLASAMVKSQKAKVRLRIVGIFGICCLVALAWLFVFNFRVPW